MAIAIPTPSAAAVYAYVNEYEYEYGEQPKGFVGSSTSSLSDFRKKGLNCLKDMSGMYFGA